MHADGSGDIACAIGGIRTVVWALGKLRVEKLHTPGQAWKGNSTMMDQFVRQEDGSIVIYFQSRSPGKELEPNWLPAPAHPFYLVMRLYGPEPAALEGNWTPPALQLKE